MSRAAERYQYPPQSHGRHPEQHLALTAKSKINTFPTPPLRNGCLTAFAIRTELGHSTRSLDLLHMFGIHVPKPPVCP